MAGQMYRRAPMTAVKPYDMACARRKDVYDDVSGTEWSLDKGTYIWTHYVSNEI